jgi:hypothetical protein
LVSPSVSLLHFKVFNILVPLFSLLTRETFGDKINLRNTTDADSTGVEINSDADSVVVTWWEINERDDTPVMRVSNDMGKTFGPLFKLATNGTIL